MRTRSVMLALASGLLALPGTSFAAPILGFATSFTSGNVLTYDGLGDYGDGRGTGYYELGSCTFDAGANKTVCTLTGRYQEGTTSSHDPGGTGSFEFLQTFTGAVNPITAISATPGDDSLHLLALGSGFFTLTLAPDSGGSFTGWFPATPFEDSIGFSGFLGSGAVCTGAPSACSLGQVGLEAGTSITGPLSAFSFAIPQPDAAPVPEPATIGLLAAGLGAAFVRRRLLT